jgi:hypothetical protein
VIDISWLYEDDWVDDQLPPVQLGTLDEELDRAWNRLVRPIPDYDVVVDDPWEGWQYWMSADPAEEARLLEEWRGAKAAGRPLTSEDREDRSGVARIAMQHRVGMGLDPL